MAIRIPGGGGGGGGSSSGDTLPIVDTTAVVKGSADATKLLRFEVDGLTTGTTRVVTWPDADVTIPSGTIATLSGAQTFTGSALTVTSSPGVSLSNASNTSSVRTGATITAGTNNTTGSGVIGLLNASSTGGAGVRATATLGYGLIAETLGASANPVIYAEGDSTHTGHILSINTEATNSGLTGNLINAAFNGTTVFAVGEDGVADFQGITHTGNFPIVIGGANSLTITRNAGLRWTITSNITGESGSSLVGGAGGALNNLYGFGPIFAAHGGSSTEGVAGAAGTGVWKTATAGSVTRTLPTAAAGLYYVYHDTGNRFTVKPNTGDQIIWIDGTVVSAATGSVVTTATYQHFVVTAIDATTWLAHDVTDLGTAMTITA